MATNRFSGVWLDEAGSTTMRYIDTGDASGLTVATAILGLSNAALFQSWNGTLLTTALPSPLSSPYNQVASIARLFYTTGTETVQIIIPAPAKTIFMADGRTVDPVAIATVTSTVVGHVVSDAGNLVTAFVTGYLDGVRSIP